MGLIETKHFFNEDGIEMKTDIYDNGMTITQEANQPEPIPEPQLTETEQAILDTAINVDYLVCMKELEI